MAIVGSRGLVEINPRDLMAREASVVGVMGAWPAVPRLSSVCVLSGAVPLLS